MSTTGNRNVKQFEHIFDMRDPLQASLAEGHRGSINTVTVRRITDNDYEGWFHDGFTPGGIQIWTTASAGAGTVDQLSSATLAGTVVTITQNSGTAVNVDLASIIPADELLVSLTVDAAGILTATMQSGTTIPVDLSQFEDNGVTAMALNGKVLEVTLEDGTVLPADLAPLVDGLVASVGITGDDLVVTKEDGTVVNVSMAKFQETLSETSPYEFTFEDGEGGQTVISLLLRDLDGALVGTNYLDGLGNLEEVLRTIDNQLKSIFDVASEDDVSVVGATAVATGPSNSLVTLQMSDGSTIPFTTVDGDIDTTINYVAGSMNGTNLVLTDTTGGTLTVDLTSAAGTDTTAANMSLTGTVLTLTDTSGNNVQVDLQTVDTDTDTNTTNNSLTLTGNTLTLQDTDGNAVTVDLSRYSTDLDTTITNANIGFSGSTITVTDTAGDTVTVDLEPMLNAFDDDTTVVSGALIGNNLVLSNNAGQTISVPLNNVSAANGVESLTTSGTVLTVNRGDGSQRSVDLASILPNITDTNTQITTLLTAGTVLTINDSDGISHSVNLAPLIANANAGNGIQSTALSGGQLTITTLNGATFTEDLSGLGVDTDTTNVSITHSGSVVSLTDSAGDVVTWDAAPMIATLDAANGVDAVALSGTTLTLTLLDGSTIPVDLSTLATSPPVEASNSVLSTVIAAPNGLSSGQWVKPNGRAATLAEIALAVGSGVEVPVEAMRRIWTDASTEGENAGNMNSNGILGHRSKRIISSTGGARIDPLFNGGYAFAEVVNGGQVTPLGAPRYDGQILYLHARSTIEVAEYFTDIVCDVNVLGIARNTDGSNDTSKAGRLDSTSFRMRNGETVMLVGQETGIWRIYPSSFVYLSGTGNGAMYQENPDGTYDIWGEKFGQLSPNAGANQQLVSGDGLPFAITNFETVRVQVTGTRANEGFVVSGATGRTNRTATDIPIYANYRSGPPISAVVVEWYVSGAIRA